MTRKKIKGMTGEPKKQLGRPTIRTDAIIDEICVRLAKGEPLNTICLDERMPALNTIYDWLYSDPSFAQQYARARELQAETYADKIVRIAQEFKSDCERLPVDKFSNDRIRAMSEVTKIEVLAHQWTASKLKPKKYGDKPVIDEQLDDKVDDVRAIEKVKDLLSAVQARVITESAK